MKFIFDHTSMGFCWLDLLAIIALVVLFFYCRKKIKEMLSLKEELENKLNGESIDQAFMAEAAVPGPVPLAADASGNKT